MITDEQADYLRALINRPAGLEGLVEWHGPYEDQGVELITDLGRVALAEYEAAHVTLTKDQLGEVFKAGYEHGWNDRTGNHDEVDERWRLSNIWDNLQAEKL